MLQMNGIQNVTKQIVTIVRKSKLHQRSDSPGPRQSLSNLPSSAHGPLWPSQGR